MQLGDSIKLYRKKLKLSREALSVKAKISEKSLYNYEENRRSPSVEQLDRIAKALKISSSELLDSSFTIKKKMTEEEIVDAVLALQYRSDLRRNGVIRIALKVLQQLPLETK
jgi:transcriptional regulator with XRE-family HTH domain